MRYDNDAYGHTSYYKLPLYQDATPFDLCDGYNHAMEIIDRKLHQLDIQIAELDRKDITR